MADKRKQDDTQGEAGTTRDLPGTGPAADGDATQDAPTTRVDAQPTAQRTAKRPQPRELPREDAGEKDAPSSSAGGDRDGTPADAAATDAAGNPVARALRKLAATVRAHRVATACAAAGVVLLAVVVTIATGALSQNLPSLGKVGRDALSNAPQLKHEAGAFDSTEALVAKSASGRSVSIKNGTVTAQARIRYSNGSITATVPVRLTYVRDTKGNWLLESTRRSGTTSYAATTGVGTSRIRAGVGAILAKADAAGSSGSSTESLASLYKDATLKVGKASFSRKGQTETVTLHLSEAKGYATRSCTVTAHFSFAAASGSWELTKATASSGARKLSLASLEGTWTGTFQSQEASGKRCFGARGQTLSLKIESVSADSKRLTGTLGCVAHYHAEPDADVDSSDGDWQLTDVTFEGTRVGEKDDPTGSTYAFELTTPEDSQGTIVAWVGFGSDDDPTRAVARVTCTHTEQESFLLIPYDATATYTDVFTLARQ
ncbi:MAG: hypothetical protein ACI38Z_08845 [Parafannyhessea sp.]|uniref:hypothetical protein n=1 Tax=Parafannyhessea sp. TaxID=2847324 RepID=UPI003EFFE01E